jgi:hypothetical protein
MIDESKLHELARAEVDRHKARGALFDKKALRFNDIVAAGVHYSRCGAIQRQGVAEDGVREAVEACVIGSAMHVPGRGPLTMIQTWMEAGAK